MTEASEENQLQSAKEQDRWSQLVRSWEQDSRLGHSAASLNGLAPLQPSQFSLLGCEGLERCLEELASLPES